MIKLAKCMHCGNIVEFVEDKGVPVVCCGEKMTVFEPNTTDAAQEKHVPVVKKEGNLINVTVGEVAHPMTEEHFIEWIDLETTKGTQRHYLKPGQYPETVFSVTEEEVPVAAYGYCNLHGYWMVEIPQAK